MSYGRRSGREKGRATEEKVPVKNGRGNRVKVLATVRGRRDGKVCDDSSCRRVTDVVGGNEGEWNRDGFDVEKSVTNVLV